jgi:hypothetical protein
MKKSSRKTKRKGTVAVKVIAPKKFANGGAMSFDFDDTLSTDLGLQMAKSNPSSNKYVISARSEVTPDMIARARQAGIPDSNIFATGSDEAKVAKIQELGIKKHLDNKKSVIDRLGFKGQLFENGGEVPYNYNPFVSAEPEVLEQPQQFTSIRTENDPEDYDQFLNYSRTAPENRRPTEGYTYGNPNDYDHYGMWDALGKPTDFNQALEMNPDWTPDEYDGMYHGFSVNPNTGVFLKAGKPGGIKEGDTTWMEISGHYLSPRAQVDTPVFDTDLQRFKYIPNKQDGGNFNGYTNLFKFENGGDPPYNNLPPTYISAFDVFNRYRNFLAVLASATF